MRAGKTTFIQNMFAAYSQDATLPVNDASAPTAKDDFISSPEKLCTDITVKDEQNMIAFHYRVQDTPGGASRPASDCSPPCSMHVQHRQKPLSMPVVSSNCERAGFRPLCMLEQQICQLCSTVQSWLVGRTAAALPASCMQPPCHLS